MLPAGEAAEKTAAAQTALTAGDTETALSMIDAALAEPE
jgi:hypothetical protein